MQVQQIHVKQCDIHEQLTRDAEHKIACILKRLKVSQDFKLVIKIGDDAPCDVNGTFTGRPNHVKRSTIVVVISDVNDLLGKYKLRTWNAILTVTFLHEYSHFLLFKKMTVRNRYVSNMRYNTSYYWRTKDETDAWILTGQLLRQLRYHEKKTIHKVMSKFVFPRNFNYKKELFHG